MACKLHFFSHKLSSPFLFYQGLKDFFFKTLIFLSIFLSFTASQTKKRGKINIFFCKISYIISYLFPNLHKVAFYFPFVYLFFFPFHFSFLSSQLQPNLRVTLNLFHWMIIIHIYFNHITIKCAFVN